MQHTLHAGRQVPRARPPESRRPRSASVDVLGFSRAHSRARPPVGADVAHAAPARCALPRTCRALPSPGGRVCPCVRSAFSDTLSGDTRMGESNMNDASVQLSHLLGARQAVEPSYGSRGRPRLSARWATTVTQGLTTRDCDSRAGPWGGPGRPAGPSRSFRRPAGPAVSVVLRQARATVRKGRAGLHQSPALQPGRARKHQPPPAAPPPPAAHGRFWPYLC